MSPSGLARMLRVMRLRAVPRTSGSVRRAAFTLIELLVVVAIIALLIAILLPALQAAKRRTKDTKCQIYLRNLAQACVMYAGDNRDWTPAHGPVDPNTGRIMQSAPSTLIWGDPLPYVPPDESVKNSLGLLMPDFLHYSLWQSYYCPLAIEQGITGEDNDKKFGVPGEEVWMQYFYRRTMNIATERVGALVCDSFYPTNNSQQSPPGVYHGELPQQYLNFAMTDGSVARMTVPGEPTDRFVAPRWYLEYIGLGAGSQAGQEAYNTETGRITDWRTEYNQDPDHPQYRQSLRFRTAPWPQFDMVYEGGSLSLAREWLLLR